jgi:dihydrofolate synthase/folylpolyglutamate synthase
MTYQQSVEYLMSFMDRERALGQKYHESNYDLQGFRQFLAELGNPQNAFKSILVAGTKGKGSTAVMIESVLRHQGLKTGLYTSPHLISFCERIKIDGKNILERDFAQRLEWLKPFLEKNREQGIHRSVFEILTAMAFLYFQEVGVEWAVLEVGVGGRLDCTNVVNPRVAVITNISLDHTDILGDTIAQIAAEKAGIIRQDALVVTSPQAAEALKVILKRCQDSLARLFQVGRDVGFRITDQSAESITIDIAGTFGSLTNLEIGLPGDFQAENAATAFATLRSLQYRNLMLSDSVIREGLKHLKWPGRMQQVSREPLIVVDGAHNGHSSLRLMDSLEKLYPGTGKVAVLGISSNKDIAGIVDGLAPGCRAVVITRARHSRAASPDAIRDEVARHGVAAIVTENLSEAVEKAMQLVSMNDLIIITGSLFLAGEALEMYGEKA